MISIVGDLSLEKRTPAIWQGFVVMYFLKIKPVYYQLPDSYFPASLNRSDVLF